MTITNMLQKIAALSSVFLVVAIMVASPVTTNAADLGGGFDYGYGYDSGDYGFDYGYGSDGYDYGYGSDGFDYGYGSDGQDYGYGTDGYDYGYGSDGYDYGYGTTDFYPDTAFYPDSEFYPDTAFYPDYMGSGGSYGSCGSSCGGYSTGGGYNMGGGSYTTPGCTGCGGGGTSFRPTSGYPVTISQPGGGSQSQSQSQSTNVVNNNTNTNVNNNTAIAVVQVSAQTATQQPTYPSYPTYPAPYCSIYQAQSGSYGNYGARSVYLSWSSSNAQSAYLSNQGSVAVNGSQTVYPTYSTTYTLTVYGYNGQQATCQTTVYGTTYTTPTTPYVSLTQIPYTGFDFGTFGNAMYFAAIAILALGGAYLAVYFIPQLAFARGTYQRSFAPVVAPKAPILLEKEAAEAKVAPIVASLRKAAGTNDSMAIVHTEGSMPKIVIERA